MHLLTLEFASSSCGVVYSIIWYIVSCRLQCCYADHASGIESTCHLCWLAADMQCLPVEVSKMWVLCNWRWWHNCVLQLSVIGESLAVWRWSQTEASTWNSNLFNGKRTKFHKRCNGSFARQLWCKCCSWQFIDKWRCAKRQRSRQGCERQYGKWISSARIVSSLSVCSQQGQTERCFRHRWAGSNTNRQPASTATSCWPWKSRFRTSPTWSSTPCNVYQLHNNFPGNSTCPCQGWILLQGSERPRTVCILSSAATKLGRWRRPDDRTQKTHANLFVSEWCRTLWECPHWRWQRGHIHRDTTIDPHNRFTFHSTRLTGQNLFEGIFRVF